MPSDDSPDAPSAGPDSQAVSALAGSEDTRPDAPAAPDPSATAEAGRDLDGHGPDAGGTHAHGGDARDEDVRSGDAHDQAAPDPADDPSLRIAPLAWHHAVLCRLALPLRPPVPGGWTRETVGVLVQLEPAATPEGGEEPPLPAGRGLRLMLLHLFTAALAGEGASVELGAGPEAVTERFGLEPTEARLRELREAAERLFSGRLRLVEGQPPGLAMLDARVRGAAGGGWRSSVRLSERFLTQLRRQAVPLDARAVGWLSVSVPALDAYAWLAATLPMVPEDAPARHGWDSLRERFADGDPMPARFQEAFTASLETARSCYPGADLVIDEAGVELRHSPAVLPGLLPPAEPPARPRRARPEPTRPEPARAAEPAAPAQGTLQPLDGPAEAPAPDEAAAGAAEPSGVAARPARTAARRAEPAARPEDAAQDTAQPTPRTAPDAAGRDRGRPAPQPAAFSEDQSDDDWDEDAEDEDGDDEGAGGQSGGQSWERPDARSATRQGDRQDGRQADRAENRQGGRAEGRPEGRVSLPPSLTGLPVAVWLRRGERLELMTIEVTPGLEYDLRRRAVLAVEPIVLQVSGALHPRELDRIAAWVATNADLIQEVWDGNVPPGAAALTQVRRLPPSRW